MKVYKPNRRDALQDGLRLSSAMTSKNAMAGLPLGGGGNGARGPRDPDGRAPTRSLPPLWDLVESLHGTYRTACDMNTSSADMDIVGERCSSVFGKTEAGGWLGVRRARDRRRRVQRPEDGRRARVRGRRSRRADGRDPGVGAVGELLARQLADQGARLVLTDVDDVRAKELAEASGRRDRRHRGDLRRRVRRASLPCATGGVLSAETIPRPAAAWWPAPRTTSSPEPEDADRLAEQRHRVRARLRRQRGRRDPLLASLEMLGE